MKTFLFSYGFKSVLYVSIALLARGCATASSAPAMPIGRASHVIVVGVDGMSPDGVEKADTPQMHRLLQSGSWTMHARGVLPTSSS